MHLSKALLAEFIGTFALIFIGAGAVVALDPNDWVAIGLAHGLVIMVFAYAFGNESNSYVNPALTIGVVVAGEGSVAAAVPVFAAQILGGIAGGLALAWIYPADPNNLGMTTIDTDVTSIAGGLFLEAVGTFLLMTAVLNTALRGVAGNMAPFAIGMTVAFCIMSFGAVTGASLNPARTLGPAVGMGDYTQVLAYSVTQIAAATAAAILYRALYARRARGEAEEPAF